MIDLDEPITVGVLFERTAVRPVWFRWQGRTVKIKEVTSRWQTSRGSVLLTHLAVTDGINLYGLVLDQRHLTWKLAWSGVA